MGRPKESKAEAEKRADDIMNEEANQAENGGTDNRVEEIQDDVAQGDDGVLDDVVRAQANKKKKEEMDLDGMTNDERLKYAEKKLEEKKAKQKPTKKLEIDDNGLGNDKVMVNGQVLTVNRPSEKKLLIERLKSIDVPEVKYNEMKLLLLKVLKKSQWAHKFRNLEVNEDPLKRWVEPIVRVNIKMRFQMAIRSLVRMQNYIVRCRCLNPANEDQIEELRAQMELRLFDLRKYSEVEEDYEPIFEVTKRGLEKTMQRLDVLQQGMGYSESEASASSDCQEEAMQRLKQTRKQMQYTIAGLA